MAKKYFFIVFTFATLFTFLILGYLGYRGARFLNRYKFELSNKMLTQSQNSEDYKQRVMFARYSDYLQPDDAAKLMMAEGLMGLGKMADAEKILLKIRDVDNYYLLANYNGKDRNIFTYEWLQTRSFAQVAHKFIIAKGPELSGRDELLLLANELISASSYDAAHEALLLGLEKDKYYPQIYQQLLATCEYVDKDSCLQYRKSLAALSWN